MDRDGTLLKDQDYLSDPDRIHIYQGVYGALKKLRKGGFKLIIGTNQSGIGRGYFSMGDYLKVQARLSSLLRARGVKIDAVYFCPHGPKDGCSCRKPGQASVRKASRKFNLDLSRCFMVGDKPSDIAWGARAGAKSVLVLTGSGKKTRKERAVRPDFTARSFAQAAEWILKHDNP